VTHHHGECRTVVQWYGGFNCINYRHIIKSVKSNQMYLIQTTKIVKMAASE